MDLFSDDPFLRKYGSWRKYSLCLKPLLPPDFLEEDGAEEFFFEAYAQGLEPDLAVRMWETYSPHEENNF